ncbi:hypothetical protein IEQ34_009666 [Dendrobium chrysotoxum]|uniref:Uncharacterized protein n=1 Tax=Dendrobium chrysotoxum TaxID=161865 RepID=A0AAV7GZ65_DENCH|nr:hypothetical protein IEQ34_009666 [Dendrobium chrysotoxum]
MLRHVRAYILFIIGCLLLLDTSGFEIHLQYLQLLTRLIWPWEQIHVRRPTLHVPYLKLLQGCNVGGRWDKEWVREMHVGNIKIYNNELDSILQSQVLWNPYGVTTQPDQNKSYHIEL